ncbi:MAG: potassium/proton antiporter [Chitinispirillales bacterium]|jgi:cell volume regulation protein A|nr:potassium/proton antiporter [Chitinispirillales bacterium]
MEGNIAKMLFIGAAIMLVIIFAASTMRRWCVPLVLFSLFAGVFFGSDVVHLVKFSDPAIAREIANFALIFVLFVGGYGTCKKKFKAVFAPATVLATVGVILTAAVTAGLFFLFFPAMGLPVAILIGCIIASTDAAAVFSILRTRALEPRLSALVEVESATNDPMAIVLTTVAVSLVADGGGMDGWPVGLVLDLIWKITGGALAGLLVGWIACRLSRYVAKLEMGYYYIFLMAIIWLSFGTAELVGASGVLSAFFAGFILGNANIPFKPTSTHFFDSLSTMSNVMIFVLLGFLVKPSKFVSVFWEGVALFLIVTFIARPIATAASTFFAKYGLKANIFLSWCGLRGAVPMVLATYPLAANINDANRLFNIICVTVLLSMVIQGSTIAPLADKFKLAGKARPRPKQVMELMTLHNSEVELVEIDIDDDVYTGSIPISSFELPDETAITMINRNDKIVVPTGQTEVVAGDILYVLVKVGQEDAVATEIYNHFELCSETGAATAV